MALAYEYIRRNKLRSVFFALLFPLTFTLFAYLAVVGFYMLGGVLAYFRPTGFLTWGSTFKQACAGAWQVSRWLLPVSFAVSAFWAWLALQEGESFILGRIRGVRPVEKWDAYEVYTLLENLCISTGDIMPRLYILEDASLNAFAVGTRPETSAIVVSSGLLKHLDRSQLEGVLAHELAHIRNYDVRMMTILITCLAFFTFTGEYLFYGTEKENIYEENAIRLEKVSRPMGFLAYVGLMLLIYGYVIAPLLRMGLSRSRESLADAQAALTTRHPHALARALWRISLDSRIEALDSSVLLGAMCIETPAAQPGFFARISGLADSHPPVEERMRALNDMDGLFLQNR